MSYSGNQPVYGTFPSDLFTGNGSNTVFTMSSVPGNDAALLVTIDGVRQHTDTYSYSANTLTFSEAPGSGAIIETVNMGSRADVIITEGVYKKTQFTATAAQTNFTIPTGYTVGFVDVYLNGIRLVVADDYTATDGSTIILATPATNGDSVEVVAYGTFNVANALLKSGDTMSGNLVVSGTSTLTAPVAIANTTGNTVVFAANGNIGINTATPAALMHITTNADTANSSMRIINSNTGSSAYSGIYFGHNTYDFVGFIGTLGNNTTGFYGGANSMIVGTNSSAPVVLMTGTTERMRVDSSGRVTTPYQPSFRAFRTSNYTINQTWTTLVFDTTTLNVGSHYNTSTGIFTAPVAGVYSFEWASIGNNEATVYRYTLYINDVDGTSGGVGRRELRLDQTNASAQYATNGSFSYHVQMAANDTARIKVYCDGGTISAYGSPGYDYTFFQGRLIG